MKGLFLIIVTAHALVRHNSVQRSLNLENSVRRKFLDSGTSVREGMRPDGSMTSRRNTAMAATISEGSITENSNQDRDGAAVEPVAGNVVFLLPSNADQTQSKFGSRSPYGNPTVLEAARHLKRKIGWFSDQLVNAQIVVMSSTSEPTPEEQMLLQKANAVIALHLSSPETEYAESLFQQRRQRQQEGDQDNMNLCHFALECGGASDAIPSICGPFDTSAASPSSLWPWTDAASGKRLDERMKGLFGRWTSDDFTYALMLFFNRFSGTPIDWCKYSIDATWEKGAVRNANEFYSMVTKCGDCVAKCVADEKCKECLDALTALDTTDQVASYRTIVSYESELLKEFSYCILQKNNIFNCDAKIPQYPQVQPMTHFRGMPLTRKAARQILIGHLDDQDAFDDDTSNGQRLRTSWKVAAGANVAYDQFPSQNQIFYEAASNRPKNDENGKQFLWYDPVFRVETIDGRNVWCKRHYRVREGPTVGTFYFSVLDNGVVSNEFWTLVDVADDLSYIIFHYAGAAGAVGQRYLGGLLCTADGSLDPFISDDDNESTYHSYGRTPKGPLADHVYSKLRSAGIEPWELFCVDNRLDSPEALDAGEAPLDYFRKDVLAEKEKRKQQQQ